MIVTGGCIGVVTGAGIGVGIEVVTGAGIRAGPR